MLVLWSSSSGSLFLLYSLRTILLWWTITTTTTTIVFVSSWTTTITKSNSRPFITRSASSRSQRNRFIQTRLFQDFSDSGDNEENYFDDFEFVIGGGNPADDIENNNRGVPSPNDDGTTTTANNDDSSIAVLQDRLQRLAVTEQAAQQQIADNWKEGYWNVWGCSLDPYVVEGISDNDENAKKTVVTCLRLVSSSSSSTITTTDEDDEDWAVLVVGRSDGSLVWLKMDTSTAPSISSYDTAKTAVQGRSMVTYFESKLTAKATKDGGMTIGSQLQRSDDYSSIDIDNDEASSSSSSTATTPPFDILAQVSSAFSFGATLDMLVLPDVGSIWTIHQEAPNVIQSWDLAYQKETGYLLPAPNQPSPDTLISAHSSPIVAMKPIPGHDNTMVLTVSEDGQFTIWEVDTLGSTLISRKGNLLDSATAFQDDDMILSTDLDEEYLFLGCRSGQIHIYSLSSLLHGNEADASPLPVKSLPGFSNRDPGVSALCIAAPGTLSQLSNGKAPVNVNNPGRPPTKTLIAGNVLGELKQWELLPTNGGLEYWPRMASQKLPGKAHVFATTSHTAGSSSEEQAVALPIRQLLVIQHVILAATDQELCFWDPATGKSLYDMQGLDFSAGHRYYAMSSPSLVVAKDSVLVTNGMDQYVCVHDFSMERVTSENAQDMIERDDGE